VNFQPELAQAVMAGRKTVTRRLVSDNPRSPWWRRKCSLEVGQDYAVCPGRGKHAIGRVRIVRVSREPLHLVQQPGEAEREGFPHFDAFYTAWSRINGDWDDMALVWRVEMEVSEILVCKACDHMGDDCVCWYVAEMAANERDEVVA
jgi:hypothetical protein